MVNLTIERQRHGWSKAELARRAHLDQGLVSKIESGRVRPYPSELRRLARALRIGRTDTEWLLADHTERPGHGQRDDAAE